MIHDGNTKIIARLHKQFSPRGLNIYNPYFDETGVNAVFLLFYNPDPRPLVAGIKNLNISGAVTVGFETDVEFAKLVDDYDASSTVVGRVGFIKNINGKLKGFYQGGKGLLLSTQSVTSLDNKEVVLIGSGNVAKSLLYELSKIDKKPKRVSVLNRTPEKLKELKSKYSFISNTGSLDLLPSIHGDILINATHIGSKQEDIYFTKEIVSKFAAVSDVTFESENTNLIKLAKELKRKYSTGWDMFTYQGLVVLETLLETRIDPIILKKHVISGLTQTVK